MVFYPDRLTWMRRKRGMTKTSLANEIGVDLRSMSAYEAAEFEPLGENLKRLCSVLNVTDDFFAKGPFEGPETSQVSFRSLSKLSASKRDQALGSAAIAFALCNWLEARFDLPTVSIPDLREDQDPEQAAMSLRYMWGLGEKPVSNMTHLLESKGVRVFSLALDMVEVDAFCTWNDDVPYVFLNTKKSNARRRFDAAHELGHLVMHRHGEYDGRTTEKEADEFASAFLMPRNGFAPTAPRLPDLRNIIPSKSQWGVSVAAYVVRLRKLDLITEWHYRTLFKQLSQRGYRKKEPFDHRPELSRLAELILMDLRSEGIGYKDVADIIGVSKEDISDLLFNIAIFNVGDGNSSSSGGGSKDHIRLAVDNTKVDE
jgi:Zn-dependent peptidase ImmA (M78 family)/DNA-binding XRE family transcriptional regulator